MSIGRHPGDLGKLGLVAGLLVLSALLVLVPANPVEVAVHQQLITLPRVADPFWVVLTWIGSWAGIAGVVVVTSYLGWIRVALLCGGSGALTWLVALLMHQLLGRPGGHPFPSDEVAVVTVLAVVAAPYFGRVARYLGWALVLLTGVAVVHLDLHLPLGAVGGALLGWGVGLLCHLVWGAPGRKVSQLVVFDELEQAGLAPISITALRHRLLQPREFAVETVDGPPLRVKVVRRLSRRAGGWYKLKRLMMLLDVQDEPSLSTPHHEVEHEAYAALLAARAGVRTPEVVLACDVSYAPALLVMRQVPGRRLTELAPEEIDDALLAGVWEQVALLAESRIAHHDLRAKNILVDERGRPWLLSFTFSHPGADDARRAQDLAEALVSVASLVGVERAVTSAIDALPVESLAGALNSLVPLALPRRIRAQAQRGRYFLAELRETLADRLGLPIPGFRSPVRPTTVLGLLLIGAAVYLLIPELSNTRDLIGALRHAHWGWLAVAVATGFAAVVLSSISVQGSSRIPLPFWPTLQVQIAAAFTGRTTPGGAGFFGINVVYLERLGLRRPLAVGVTLLNQAGTGAVAVVVAVIGVFAVGLSGTFTNLSLPGWQLVVASAAVLLVAVLVLLSPPGRRRLLPSVLEVSRELLDTLRHPVRALQLFGGGLGYLVVSGLGLAASLAALHPHFSWTAVTIVFVIGNTLGHLVPSPGGLGAVEAVLLAGLGAMGIPPTAAVAAVLLSRLLTYWLPVLPGILMFRYLQHRNVI
ncbi:lysylphosphatidylglycerol synthase transmembrane domain-containing protein [Saccharopolyspora mangrovi]|uniref:Lysylphosphatidylglycerol synthase transmembrane domain-containing protein n=1 Tax=Saccharopolyspora mangrovi TaxID=3082379 RepID=A0ABU6A6F9_9PSEU|nr:lysylphosphatidylglycerol synthase transmembrane domain-containing protein [Saccharopolyspora sp. S2-29]MEB3367137.1 lysylphosphatidylglycerol synthase transmembrane domain-containing protein [Saccharopolyspora sp. S2-29]